MAFPNDDERLLPSLEMPPLQIAARCLCCLALFVFLTFAIGATCDAMPRNTGIYGFLILPLPIIYLLEGFTTSAAFEIGCFAWLLLAFIGLWILKRGVATQYFLCLCASVALGIASGVAVRVLLPYAAIS